MDWSDLDWKDIDWKECWSIEEEEWASSVLKSAGTALAVALVLVVALGMPVSVGTPAAVFLTAAYRLDHSLDRTNPTHHRI